MAVGKLHAGSIPLLRHKRRQGDFAVMCLQSLTLRYLALWIIGSVHCLSNLDSSCSSHVAGEDGDVGPRMSRFSAAALQHVQTPAILSSGFSRRIHGTSSGRGCCGVHELC